MTVPQTVSNVSTVCSLPRSASNSSSDSSSLTVQTKPNGNIVYYKISKDADVNPPKMARYSELERLHQQVMQEVPAFQGVFPPKKWRSASSRVLEMRRSMIEEYLRGCINNTCVKNSKA